MSGEATPKAPPGQDHDQSKAGDTETPSLPGSRLKSALGRSAAVVTLAIAVWGAVSGTIAWQQGREISLSISARTDSGFFAEPSPFRVGGEEIQASLVNASARSASLVRGDVEFDGRVVGLVSEVTPGANASLTSLSVPLPYTVDAGASQTVRLGWSVLPSMAGFLASSLSVPVLRRHLVLQLQFDPGGNRSVRVVTGQAPTTTGGWALLIWVRHGKPSLISALPDAGVAAGIATLQVWSDNLKRQAPILVRRRPAGPANGAWFDVAALHHGGYDFALTIDSQTVSSGLFSVPCVGSDGAYQVQACADGDVGSLRPLVAWPPRPYGRPVRNG